MAQKINVSENDTFKFKCPKCKVVKEEDVSKFKELETSVNFKVKCTCGNSYSVNLERRKFYRKEISSHGMFFYRPLNEKDQKGEMTVLDISAGGLKLKTIEPPKFRKGDIIEVEFSIAHNSGILIKKHVIVRNIKDNVINAEFCSFKFLNDPQDRNLWFYLY